MSVCLRCAQVAKQLAPTWAKASYREAQAFYALAELPDAAASFWEAHRLEPRSDAHQRFNRCVFEARQKQGMQRGALSDGADGQAGEAQLKAWAAESKARAPRDKSEP